VINLINLVGLQLTTILC